MKSILLGLVLILDIQQSQAMVSCGSLPKSCRIKEVTYTVSDISGDYRVKVRVPDLANQNCTIEGDRVKISFGSSAPAEVSFSKSSRISQKITYAAIQCRADAEDGGATQFTLLGPSKILPNHNVKTVNLDYNQTESGVLLKSVTYFE